MLQFRPFEILKLIRDRLIENIGQHGNLDGHLAPEKDTLDPKMMRGFTPTYYELLPAIQYLIEGGWIYAGKNGRVTVTKKLVDLQRGLQLSLSQLSPYQKDSVIANSVFGKPEIPDNVADIFVLMPYTDEMRFVYDRIRSVSSSIGISTGRADDIFSSGSVMNDVWNLINSAKILIADCTTMNPNVFYELGIAHTLGKPTILIAQSQDDIPFDIAHMIWKECAADGDLRSLIRVGASE